MVSHCTSRILLVELRISGYICEALDSVIILVAAYPLFDLPQLQTVQESTP